MFSLQGTYGGLSALSLIEKSETSHEYKLGLAYAKAMAQLCRDVTYLAFDFHKVCGKLSFKNLPQLGEQCEAGLSDHGYFIAGERKQVGVWRVNCVDCLDRTNVAQSVVAFRTLVHQLCSAGCIEADHRDTCLAAARSDNKMPLEWAARLHQQFKSLWADHGDTISIQYSGSQALKGDLTRTGKRTVGGLLQDGVSSIRRAVQNNFADYHRQQVMEAFHQLPPANPERNTAASSAGSSPLVSFTSEKETLGGDAQPVPVAKNLPVVQGTLADDDGAGGDVPVGKPAICEDLVDLS